MSEDLKIIDDVTGSDYKWGFVSNIESENAPKGLNEDTVRFISAKKNEPEWLLAWRLKAFRHWQQMVEPSWPNVQYPEIDFQDIIYYSAPKKKPTLNSLDELDPEIKATIGYFARRTEAAFGRGG
jgi:Fe-S cluster assembly protein SufB